MDIKPKEESANDKKDYYSANSTNFTTGNSDQYYLRLLEFKT